MARSYIEMRRTTRATIRSTFAATKAAKATIAVERARFYIVIDKHNLTEIVKLVENSEAGENSDIPGGDNISITYRFKNYGKTPGIIRDKEN